MIGQLLGSPGTMAAVGEAAKDVAEVFTPSATKRMELVGQGAERCAERVCR